MALGEGALEPMPATIGQGRGTLWTGYQSVAGITGTHDNLDLCAIYNHQLT